MNLKEFIKPTPVKIVLFLIFVIILGFIPLASMGGGNESITFYFSLPIPSVTYKETFCHVAIAPSDCVPESGFDIFWPGLIINLIFWYLISCLIIFGYNKVMKK